MSKRSTSIPVAAWWYEAAKRALKRRGWKQVDLAKQLGTSEANVSRCMTGDIPSLRLLQDISETLGIPRPVFIPETEMQALACHGALGLLVQDQELESIVSEVAPTSRTRARGTRNER